MTAHGSGWAVPGYVAEELIGFGASGEVWRGRATDSGEPVALKRLRPGADHARLLEREAALQATVDHPHLLRLRELVATEEATVLVLDYAAGGSLAQLLRRRGRLTPGEVVTVLAPVAAALAHAHSEGLVHGDVSPANVLFTADGQPLLADLGVARVLGERGEPRCTPEYMDPAVAAGSAPGASSDVFMVAAVAVHALTGMPPWHAPSPEQAVALAASGCVPDLHDAAPDAPTLLIEAVQRALARVPADRGSAAELALDMRHGCAPEPVRLVPDRPPVGGLALLAAATSSSLTHVVEGRSLAGRSPATSGASARHRGGARRSARVTGLDIEAAPQPRRSVGGVLTLRRSLVAVTSVVLAVLAGVTWGLHGFPERSPDLTTAPASAGHPTGPEERPPGPSVHSTRVAASDGPRWLVVLDALDRVRAQAYERGDPALLRHVYVPGKHLVADSAQLRALAQAGDIVRGARHRLGRLDVLRVWTGHVQVRVVQSLLASQRVHRGRVVGVIPGTSETAVLADLVATPAGWRLA